MLVKKKRTVHANKHTNQRTNLQTNQPTLGNAMTKYLTVVVLGGEIPSTLIHRRRREECPGGHGGTVQYSRGRVEFSSLFRVAAS